MESWPVRMISRLHLYLYVRITVLLIHIGHFCSYSQHFDLSNPLPPLPDPLDPVEIAEIKVNSLAKEHISCLSPKNMNDIPDEWIRS